MPDKKNEFITDVDYDSNVFRYKEFNTYGNRMKEAFIKLNKEGLNNIFFADNNEPYLIMEINPHIKNYAKYLEPYDQIILLTEGKKLDINLKSVFQEEYRQYTAPSEHIFTITSTQDNNVYHYVSAEECTPYGQEKARNLQQKYDRQKNRYVPNFKVSENISDVKEGQYLFEKIIQQNLTCRFKQQPYHCFADDKQKQSALRFLRENPESAYNIYEKKFTQIRDLIIKNINKDIEQYDNKFFKTKEIKENIENLNNVKEQYTKHRR